MQTACRGLARLKRVAPPGPEILMDLAECAFNHEEVVVTDRGEITITDVQVRPLTAIRGSH